MTDEEQIMQVFRDFEDGGLVSKDIGKVLRCVSDRVIGIGIGEQGFVRSKEDIRKVFESGLREDDTAAYSLEYEEMEILVHGGRYANACGEICIKREVNGGVMKSKLLQTLIFIKENGEWKICGLHASAPAITEENIKAYPLKYAEKLLCSLRDEIGEKAYLAEEQFQRAVLADTIAFYILNVTKNCLEKCHVNEELCAYVEPGTPYENFIQENTCKYVDGIDCERFLEKLSLGNIVEAFQNNEKEISCEYRLKRSDGTSFWAVTVIRLITDCVTGDYKGIIYVKDIDKQKRRESEMRSRAERDDMTDFYKKAAFVGRVEKLLADKKCTTGSFLMLDVDNFKTINDTFGHPCGDSVLISIAGMIREVFGGNGIFGRLGGDEFGIFAPGRAARELMRKEVEELMHGFGKIRLPDQEFPPISCSMGIVEIQCGDSFRSLYELADQALYRSKQEGKKRCTVYGWRESDVREKEAAPEVFL